MMNELKTTDTHHNHTRGHELRDANVRAVTMFGIGLAVLTGIVLLLMVWLQDFLNAQKVKSEPPVSPLAAQRPLPPGPRLQVVPEKELAQLHAMEDSLLHQYGWVIREANVVRIPIDSAIALVARRGLPVRPVRMQSDERKAKSEKGGE
jgi:hypothetical protein